MSDRRQRVLLAVITGVALLRGGWWVATTPIWSPIDEQAHYDYARALGELEGLPVVGETRVHREVLQVAKDAATSPWRAVPIPADPQDHGWGIYAYSYQGAQPPLFYAALAPLTRAVAGLEPVVAIYVLRVASLLLALLLVPLVWLLGRELFPDRGEVGVAAAALTAALSGVNGNLAIIANDGLMAVLSAAALLVTARVVRRGFTTVRAVLLGALLGAAVLTKLTAIGLAGVVAVGVVLAWRRHAAGWRDAARFAAVSGVAVAAVLAPWVWSNLATYDGLTASRQLDALTGPLQSDPPLNLRGLTTRLEQAGHGFWDQQLLDTGMSPYSWLWTGFALVVGAAALMRHRARRAELAWLLGAWPIVFGAMAFVILGLSGGRSDIAGRHLYAALPFVVVGVAAATVLVAGRWAAVVLATVCAVGFTMEARAEEGILRAVYARGAFANLTPVVDAAYADRVVPGHRFELAAPCPTIAVRLVFAGGPAPTITVNGTATPPFTPEPLDALALAAHYAVADAATRISVDVPRRARIAASLTGVAHSIYCVAPDNEAARFAQTFGREHPALSLQQVLFVPRLWAVVGWVGVIAALTRNIARWGRSDAGASASRSSSSAAP